MGLKHTLAAVGGAVLATACSTVGMRSGTEEPAFERLAQVGEITIRRYGERIAAETEAAGDSAQARSEGFQRLAGYIFGGNSQRASIAMTAPVAQSGADRSRTIAMTAPVAQSPSGDGRWTIQFFMPSRYAMTDLPLPNDPSVHLAVVPAETYAVLKFSGVGSAKAVQIHRARLLAGLAGSGCSVRGEPVVWFYEPPWTLPPLRRNEVAVRVEPE